MKLSTMQEVPEKSKESAGGPWEFCGLLPLFDPPRHDSAETIKRALNLGVNVKMITGTWKKLVYKHSCCGSVVTLYAGAFKLEWIGCCSFVQVLSSSVQVTVTVDCV